MKEKVYKSKTPILPEGKAVRVIIPGRKAVKGIVIGHFLRKGEYCVMLPGGKVVRARPKEANPTLSQIDYPVITMDSMTAKLSKAMSQPLRKPTKAQLRRWANMPDPFAGITEKDREEAFKKGFII